MEKGWRRRTRKRLNRQSRTENYLFKKLNEWGYSPKRNKFVKVFSGNFYFLDFYFKRWKLAVELDGSEHENRSDLDKQRELDISRSHGIKFLRFKNSDVWGNVELIRSVLEKKLPPRKKRFIKKSGFMVHTLRRECEKMDEAFYKTCM